MHIIFDFDGTIADSGRFVEDYFRRYPHIDVTLLRKEGMRAFLKEHRIGPLRTMIGVRLMKRAMGRHIADLRPAIPKAVIRELATHHTLSILSSNSRENIMAFLIKENMHQYFRIVHADTSLFGKDRMLRRMMEKYRLNAREVVYVGDEDRDIVAAKAVGLRVIAVTWGYNERSLLLKRTPDGIIDKPESLRAALTALRA